jgi:3-oxoacyl-[acyl-carrier protein] reductase
MALVILTLMRFTDKVVLVTGAARGVGKATALEFAKEGAIVVVNYAHSQEQADYLVSEIQELGSRALAIKCDVSVESQVIDMITTIIDNFGRLDILVNNAAIVFDGDMLDKTVEQWQQTMAVNLIGPFLCAKHSAKYLSSSKGSIINVCSTSGYNSFAPTSADYDSSKVGLIALTKNLAKELAPNVRVNGVAPSWIDTDMNSDLPKDYLAEEMAKILTGRMATPEEIAKPILFLGSDDASYINATILFVDGGIV